MVHDMNWESVIAYLNEGNQLKEASFYDKALECYEKALEELNLETVAIYNQQAEVYCLQGKVEEAITCCQKALTIKPNYAVGYKTLGNVFLVAGKVEEARDSYVKAIEIQPDYAAALANLGSIYAQQQSWEEAISYYQKAIAIQPNFAGVYRNLAKIFSQIDKLEEAAECSYLGLILEPGKATAEEFLSLGNSLLEQGKQERAIICYRRAIELNSNFSEAYYSLGEALATLEQWEEAIACYGKAIELSPESVFFHSSLWVVVCKTQNWDLAVTSYRRTLEVKPDSSLVCHHLGAALICLQQWDEAVPYLQRAVKLNPISVWSYRLLGDALSKLGQIDRAIETYQQCVQLQPNYIVYCYIGSLLTISGKINEAIGAYEQAVVIQPDSAEVYWNLAWLFSQKEQFDEAISCYQKACEIKPCSNEEHFQLTSQYTFINLYSLSDSDQTFMKNVGISLPNLELIEQDNATWKKMYSAQDWSQLLIFMPEFQQRILETGYINLFCPYSGKILNSNQSFYLGLDYNITLYRFSGVHIFYLIVGCSHTLKLGIYIPAHELIISFCDPTYSFLASYKARFESWINNFKCHTISCLDKVKSYISNNDPKHVTAALGFLPNLGHYFMNELSAFQELHKKHLLINKLNSFLIGPYNYFDIREVFPEITKENSIISVFQIQQKQYSRLAFETCLTYNLFALTLTNFIIQEQLANRLYHSSLIKCQESFLQKVGESKQYFPLVWITLRSHRRSWLDQIEGMANIINELFKEYQNLAIIFDGMSSEKNNLDKIKALIHPSIKTYNAIECELHETIVWVYAIDTFIAPFGAGSIFTSIANKPGVFHANTGFCRPEPFCISPRENCVLASSVPVGSVVDYFDSSYNQVSDRNYNCDWKALYAELIKMIELLTGNQR